VPTLAQTGCAARMAQVSSSSSSSQRYLGSLAVMYPEIGASRTSAPTISLHRPHQSAPDARIVHTTRDLLDNCLLSISASRPQHTARSTSWTPPTTGSTSV
jgi:hypothetical protein